VKHILKNNVDHLEIKCDQCNDTIICGDYKIGVLDNEMEHTDRRQVGKEDNDISS